MVRLASHTDVVFTAPTTCVICENRVISVQCNPCMEYYRLHFTRVLQTLDPAQPVIWWHTAQMDGADHKQSMQPRILGQLMVTSRCCDVCLVCTSNAKARITSALDVPLGASVADFFCQNDRHHFFYNGNQWVTDATIRHLFHI